LNISLIRTLCRYYLVKYSPRKLTSLKHQKALAGPAAAPRQQHNPTIPPTHLPPQQVEAEAAGTPPKATLRKENHQVMVLGMREANLLRATEGEGEDEADPAVN
jgi:hypothetical protein